MIRFQCARNLMFFAGLLAGVLALAACNSGHPGDRSETETATATARLTGPHGLTGTVFGGGLAMPNTAVEALADGTTDVIAASTTDAAGGYAMSLADGTYDLRVTPPAGSGFGVQSIQNVTLAGADRREDIILIAAGGVVTGHVRGYGGTPLTGVNVGVYEIATWGLVVNTTTDGAGAYQLNLAAGKYRFILTPSYPPPAGGPNGSWWYYRLDNQSVSGPTLDLELPVWKVTGLVTNGGVPVPDVPVAAAINDYDSALQVYKNAASTVQTDGAGRYELLVFAGSNALSVSPPPPLSTIVQSGVIISGDITRDFSLIDTVTSGHVLGHGGAPLAGVTVTVYDPETWGQIVSTTTDAGGAYQLNLGAGTYRFILTPPYPLPAGGPNQYWYYRREAETITGSGTLDFDLGVAKIEGVVSDGHGAPMPNVSVGAAMNEYTGTTYKQVSSVVQTDAAGHYEILVLAGSNVFMVTPAAPLGILVQSGVAVTGDATRDFSLSETLTSGYVRGHAGTPIAGVTLTAYDIETWAQIVSTTTDESGAYRLRLGAGTYRFILTPPYPRPAGGPDEYWHHRLDHQAFAGGTFDFDVPVSKVTGLVSDANGAPVPNVSLAASIRDYDGAAQAYKDARSTAQTTADGRYTMYVLRGSNAFIVTPPAASGFSTTVLSNVTVSDDFTQRIVLQRPDLSPPIIVSGPSVVHLSDTSVSVRWQTNEPADSVVDYGPGGLTQVASQAALSTTHEVTLLGLLPSTIYQYRVGSTDGSGNGPTRSAIGTFTTQAPPGDVTPPVITGGPTVTAIGQASALVGWTTDEPASSVVRYGTDAMLGNTVSLTGVFTPNHQVVLMGLSPSTTYFVRVESTDPDGNGPTASAVISFTTAAVPDTQAPQITAGPAVTSATDTTLTVEWTTDEPATSGVSYNDGTTFFVVTDDRLVTQHQVVLAGLNPDTMYFITVSSIDAAGNGPTLGGPISARTRPTATNTPPTVTVPADMTVEATGASGATVTFAASAQDAEDGALVPSCTPASGTLFAFGPKTVTCTATDSAGASSSASFTITVGDHTPPTFTSGPTGTNVYATCTTGMKVAYKPPVATDAVGTVTVKCTPASGATFPVGGTNVTCKATDTAGNVAQTTFKVEVVYQAPTDGTFFLPPIKSDGSGSHKKGAALPVKFRLTGASARITDLQARLWVAPVVGGVAGPYQAAAAQGASGTGNLFRYNRQEKLYIFNLDTKGLAIGVWSLKADLGDGVSHTVNIKLVK